MVGFGDHLLSLGLLLQHPLSCGGILGLLGLRFENVDELFDGVRGRVRRWDNSCNGVGETVSGANERISRRDCRHCQVFVLEKYYAAFLSMSGVIDEDLVAAIMFGCVTNVKSAGHMRCPGFTDARYKVGFDFAAKGRKGVGVVVVLSPCVRVCRYGGCHP